METFTIVTVMKKNENHPTVQWWRYRRTDQSPVFATPLNADSLRELCLQAGADDVGFVEIDRPEIAD